MMRLKRIICCILLICIISPFAVISGKSAEIYDDSFFFSIPVSYDTYIRKGYGTNDYSGENTMIVDGRASSERIGVMRFKYGSEAAESIEAVADLANQITLRLRVNQNPGSPRIEIYGICDEVMKSSWADGEMNYDLAVKLGILDSRGKEQVPLIAASDMEGVSASDYLEFDVTDYIKSQAAHVNEAGDAEFAFLICGKDAYSPSDYFRVYADKGNGTTSDDNLPKLLVSSGREGLIKRDAMLLDIEKKHQVTEDFELPAVIGVDRDEEYRSAVEWRSDTNSVISLEKNDNGYIAHVKRPPSAKHGDAAVTLSAAIKNGDLSEFRSFKLYVPPVGVYNASVTNYVRSNSEESSPDSVVYAYIKGKTKYEGFVKFNLDEEAFEYTPKAVLRMKPYFMQGAFTLTITAIDYMNTDECTSEMTWKTSQNLINDSGMDSVTINQNPNQKEWIEWDVTDYINYVGGDPVFRFEVASTGTAYCMMYGNAEKYMPQLKLYNYELVTDAKGAVESVAESIESEMDIMRGELNAVTGDIELPCPEKYGVMVEWLALDENDEPSQYLDSGGRLKKQPSADENDAKVKLRAIIDRDGYESGPLIIEYEATVLKQVSDEEAVRYNEKNLALKTDVLTDSGVFPSGFYGVTIEWTAEPEGIIAISDNKYEVIKRADSDTDIKIKASIKMRDEVSAEKTFDAKILRNSKENLIYGMQILGSDTNMEKTNDDDMLTYYSSESDFNIDYAVLSDKEINNVVIAPYNSAAVKSIGIYVSDNAEDWRKICDTTVSEGINSIITESAKANYLRLEVRTDGTAGGIREAGAYNRAVNDNNTVTAEDIIKSSDFVKQSGIPQGIVKNDFKLLKAVNGAQIKWYSSDNSVVLLTEANSFYSAALKHSDKIKGVTLRAVVSINGTTAEREFPLSVSSAAEGTASFSGSGGGGGKNLAAVTTEKPSVTEKPQSTAKPVQTSAPEQGETEVKFRDLNLTPWAKEPITVMYKRGIINGKSEYEFMPTEPVTREEFVKLVTLAAGIQEGGTCGFSDLDPNEWYYPYISAAVNEGFVNGIGDGKFGLGRNITRQDMTVMISKTVKQRESEAETVTFKDSHEISDYAVGAVNSMSALGIISGDENGNFKPLAFATRAEAAVMIYRMTEINERIK